MSFSAAVSRRSIRSALALSSRCSVVFSSYCLRSCVSCAASASSAAFVSARSLVAMRRLRSASATFLRFGSTVLATS